MERIVSVRWNMERRLIGYSPFMTIPKAPIKFQPYKRAKLWDCKHKDGLSSPQSIVLNNCQVVSLPKNNLFAGHSSDTYKHRLLLQLDIDLIDIDRTCAQEWCPKSWASLLTCGKSNTSSYCQTIFRICDLQIPSPTLVYPKEASFTCIIPHIKWKLT